MKPSRFSFALALFGSLLINFPALAQNTKGPRKLLFLNRRKNRYMSRNMSSPIVGSLAGNLLKRFRVELDYPNAKLYLSAP